MKFRIVKDQFLEGLQQAQHIVGARTSLPILSNVRLRASEQGLELTTTDLDVGVKCTVSAEVLEEGETTLPARKLFSIIKELPTTDIEVSVSADHEATLESGTAFFRILGIDPEEFPELPELDEEKVFTLDQGLFKAALRKTSFAISTDETRYVLNGVLLSFREEKMTLVATDGRRLSMVEAEVEFPAGYELEVIVPTKAVQELERMLTEDEQMEMRISNNQASFRISNGLLVTKLIDGKYPNFRQVIPSEPRHRVRIDREILLSTASRVGLLSSDRGQGLKLSFEDNELTISTSAPEVGEAREKISVQYDKEPLHIAFNPEFLMAPLRKLGGDEVILELIDGVNPGVLKVEGESFLYVIMPLRV